MLTAAPTPIHVHINVFEGPMDLLLHLIKKDNLDICDINIAEITTQYLDYLNVMKELNLEVAGEFLVMASTLMQIKAKTASITRFFIGAPPCKIPWSDLIIQDKTGKILKKV